MPSKIFTSTAYTSGTRTAANLNSDFAVRNVDKEVTVLEAYNYPLTAYLYLNDLKRWTTTNNPTSKVEWGQDELVQNVDTIATYTSGAGGTTLTLDVTTGALFQVGMKIRFDDISQAGRVASVSTNTITVVRDGGLNWNVTAPTNGSLIELMGWALGENAAVPTSITTNKFMRFTYCSIFQYPLSINERLMAAMLNGGVYGGIDWDYEIEKKQLEMKRDIEEQFWWNDAPTLYSVSANEYATSTAGLVYQIRNDGAQIKTYSGAYDEDELLATAQLKKIGTNSCTYFVGDDLASDIEKIVFNRYSNRGPVKKYGAIDGRDNVRVIDLDIMGKKIDVIRCPLWEGSNTKRGILVDDKFIQPVQMANDHKGSRKMRFETNIQTPGSPRKEAQYKADVGIKAKNGPAHVIVEPA